ncbi:MAG: hypothetical protein ACOCRX_04925 [Candidatus Woesearchaeota archaeon]
MSLPFHSEEEIQYVEYKEDIIHDTINRPLKRLYENIYYNYDIKADISYVDDKVQQIGLDHIPRLYSYYYELVVDSNGEITIPLETFDKETDTTILFLDGKIIEESEYQIEENKISFETITESNTIIAIILKNVPMGPEGYINGDVIAINSMPGNRLIDDSVPYEKLDTELKELIDEIDGSRLIGGTVIKQKLDVELQDYIDEINGSRISLNSISKSRLDEELQNYIDIINGDRLVNESVPYEKLDAELKQLIDEIDGSRLINNSVPYEKLDAELKEDLDYYRRIYFSEPENPTEGDFLIEE